MAVAHDAHTKSTVWTTTPNPFTFTHTPSGTPRGVMLMLISPSTGAGVTSVTYGGVPMDLVVQGADTAGEAFVAYIYFLGRGIPTGAQTVSIAYAGGFTRIALAATVTASGDTEVAVYGKAEQNQANPQITLNSEASALRYFVIGSGLPNVPDLTLIAGMSAVNSHDFGSNVGRWDRETSPSSGATAVGYTSATDDVGMAAVAIREFISRESQPQVQPHREKVEVVAY